MLKTANKMNIIDLCMFLVVEGEQICQIQTAVILQLHSGRQWQKDWDEIFQSQSIYLSIYSQFVLFLHTAIDSCYLLSVEDGEG